MRKILPARRLALILARPGIPLAGPLLCVASRLASSTASSPFDSRGASSISLPCSNFAPDTAMSAPESVSVPASAGAPAAAGPTESKKRGGKKDKGEDKKFTLKTPKGTTDFGPAEMALRDRIFQTVTRVFKKHGGVTIDTPVFELKEILSGKYGEDSKLIYDLQDQGGELCSLRYDLTVPFARFLAMHGKQIMNIKRYQIAKVYRRDQPAMNKGRRREFYQCDFDIAGSYDLMVPDAEVLAVLVEALTALDVGPFVIKLNHRKILDGIFEVCGVPADNYRPISSAVDKMDKLPWAEVKAEMLQKGLEESVADAIGEYIKLKGSNELVEKLAADENLSNSESAKTALKEMALLFKFLDVFQVTDKISFDMSLARGLDYYTGVIYEAILLDEPTTAQLRAQTEQKENRKKPAKKEKEGEKDQDDENDESVGMGSIAAGGRYDDLVGMFAGTTKKGVANKIPCVGVSLGVERIFSVLQRRQAADAVKSNATQVYVMAVGDGLLVERMALVKQLWDAGISAEFMYKNKPKLQAQFNVCDKELIPLAVMIGPDEVVNAQVRIKDMRAKTEGEGASGLVVARDSMIDELRKRLADI